MWVKIMDHHYLSSKTRLLLCISAHSGILKWLKVVPFSPSCISKPLAELLPHPARFSLRKSGKGPRGEVLFFCFKWRKWRILEKNKEKREGCRTHPGYPGAAATCALWGPPLPAGSGRAGSPWSALGIFPALRSWGAAPAAPGKC